MQAMAALVQTATVARAGMFERVLLGLLCLHLCTMLFEGPLRWGLANVGLGNALYLRDLIPAGTIAFLFSRRALLQGDLDPVLCIAAALIAFHSAIAVINGRTLFSIGFGAKIFIALPYGMAMWPFVRPRLRQALFVALAMFAITVAGVLINFSVGQMPWEGLEYETAFGTLSTTRMWWIPGGISRLPGFTRTSFDAAMILGITGFLAMLLLRRMAAQLAVALLTVVAIVATTTKGMLVAFPLAMAWAITSSSVRRSGSESAALVVLAALASVTFAFPVLIVMFGRDMSPAGFPPLVYSAWERFTQMWPEAFELLSRSPLAALGAGLGSIGTPQLYGDEPHRFNAADSLAVYMLVSFGLAGVAYYFAPLFTLRRVAREESYLAYRVFVGLLLVTYSYGLSINMIEESFFAVVFGLCLGIMVPSNP